MLIEIAAYLQDLWSIWTQTFSAIPYGNPFIAVASPLIVMFVAVSEIVSRQNYLALKPTNRDVHIASPYPTRSKNRR